MDLDYKNVLARITGIILTVLKKDMALAENTEFQADIGMTSLQVMELIFEIEESFDISFPLNRLPAISAW